MSVGAFWAFNGVLCASCRLIIMWDSNQDYHGGFQVACKRIEFLEILRTAAGTLADSLSCA